MRSGMPWLGRPERRRQLNYRVNRFSQSREEYQTHRSDPSGKIVEYRLLDSKFRARTAISATSHAGDSPSMPFPIRLSEDPF